MKPAKEKGSSLDSIASNRDERRLFSQLGDHWNCIARDTKISGHIKSPIGVLLEGEVTGSIQTPSNLYLGKEGVLRGELDCSEAFLLGTHNGAVNASERVWIGVQANIESRIITQQLIIESGARFTGSLQLGKKIKRARK